MKIIKEAIANLERCINDDTVDAVGCMPITMADAYLDSKKVDEIVDKEKKEVDPLVGAEKQPIPKAPIFPKSTLDESLFEDYSNTPNCDMLYDMIEEDLLNVKSIAQDLIYWVGEDDITEYMRVNDLLPEYEDEDYDECLTESLISKYNLSGKDDSFYYRFLDRLKSDCKYFLGNGDKYEKHLWTHDVNDQIGLMREIYDLLDEKPEWLSKKDIDEFEANMKNVNEKVEKGRKLGPRKSTLPGGKTKEEPWDMFTLVMEELSPTLEGSGYQMLKKLTKFPDKSFRKRYDSYSVGVTDTDRSDIEVYAEKEEDFDFAKQVANAYGLEISEPKKAKDGNMRVVIKADELEGQEIE